MSEGVKIRRKKRIRNILIAISWIVAMVAGWKFSEHQHEQLMAISYCYDSNGEHYVAPDERCQ